MFKNFLIILFLEVEFLKLGRIIKRVFLRNSEVWSAQIDMLLRYADRLTILISEGEQGQGCCLCQQLRPCSVGQTEGADRARET